MTYKEFFAEVKKKFSNVNVSDMKEHLAYQFNITGEEQGAFYLELKDGELHMEPYEYYDRDALFTCKAETLRKIADGDLDPVKAVALQKLKVEGNIEKALKLKELLGRL